MTRAMLVAVLTAAVATPALAQSVVQEGAVFTPVVREITVTELIAPDLNHYVGGALLGAGRANLGTVSSANPYTGVIGVTGRHGEFAMISASMLAHWGPELHAPTLTAGDIKLASEAQLSHPNAILAAPQVIVVEPPAG